MFPKLGVPKNGWFIMETLLKWMIWGYHSFWKHPYMYAWICLRCLDKNKKYCPTWWLNGDLQW